MDARDQKPGYSRTERCVFAVLVVLFSLGLWQGYGAWLLSGAGDHVG